MISLRFSVELLSLWHQSLVQRIIKYGSSRPCGINHNRSSFHAEHLAIDYCMRNPSRNNDIYIWKFKRNHDIKRANCCHSCTILAKKYDFNIFTFDENMERCSAIIENPEISLCYKIKNNVI